MTTIAAPCPRDGVSSVMFTAARIKKTAPKERSARVTKMMICISHPQRVHRAGSGRRYRTTDQPKTITPIDSNSVPTTADIFFSLSREYARATGGIATAVSIPPAEILRGHA